ncbi:MAG: translation initiation inhibitor [Planctomycetes bacterium]|nr:translation initiation inhibitor [Planctomycetota bacterium]
MSWVDQPPTAPAQVAMWAYHVSDPARTLEKSHDGVTLTWTRNGLSHCWTTGIVSPAAVSAFDQTRAAFEQYEALLAKRRLSLAQHVVRTWLFVKDIGANYAGVVDARRECFERHGLTAETHYIASTGIEGAGVDPRAVITLDALAIAGMRPEQIRYLSAPGHMCPTYAYGVTFERGTALHYRDRTHVFVSGTASIDAQGRIVHTGDVSRQLDRALTNIAALLRSAGGDLADMALFIAYVRDAADQDRVSRMLRARCGGAPIEVVSAAVCRPGWLVEVEGIAVLPAQHPELPVF